MPTTQQADRLRALADGMNVRIQGLQQPRKENTPKRQKEGAYRRIEIAHLRRAQTALHILADAWDDGTIPNALKGLKTKAEILEVFRTILDNSGGYYEVRDTCEFADQSPRSKEFRQFVELKKNPQQQRDEAAQAWQASIIEMENKLRFARIDGFFPTPQSLADQLVEELDCQPGIKLLEPSAGKGDLVDAVRRKHGDSVDITCIERHNSLVEILKAKEYTVIPGDFTEYTPHTAVFDRVLMNPPYENGQDMLHVEHAMKFLKPGGRLIALMGSGYTFRNDARSSKFRNLLSYWNATTEDIGTPFDGQGAFRQTGVRVMKVTIDKPGVAVRHETKSPSRETIQHAGETAGTVNRILELLSQLAVMAGKD